MVYYAKEKLKTKDDYINLLKEIEAYRSLDGENFDFGTGLLINEMSYGSEDAYYEIDIQSIEDILEYLENDRKRCDKKKKHKPSRRELVKRKREKLKWLQNISWVSVNDKGEYLVRCYRGKRSSFLKKVSNRKVRRYNKDLSKCGSMYRKVYDYWNTLY